MGKGTDKRAGENRGGLRRREALIDFEDARIWFCTTGDERLPVFVSEKLLAEPGRREYG
jgi:hypothetical protein